MLCIVGHSILVVQGVRGLSRRVRGSASHNMTRATRLALGRHGPLLVSWA